jgi:hypothetical protein
MTTAMITNFLMTAIFGLVAFVSNIFIKKMDRFEKKIEQILMSDVAYTVVDTTGWTLPLNEHPSIVENPEIFEIVDEEIPEHAQTLIYKL